MSVNYDEVLGICPHCRNDDWADYYTISDRLIEVFSCCGYFKKDVNFKEVNKYV